MQGGPVDELLDVDVERGRALDAGLARSKSAVRSLGRSGPPAVLAGGRGKERGTWTRLPARPSAPGSSTGGRRAQRELGRLRLSRATMSDGVAAHDGRVRLPVEGGPVIGVVDDGTVTGIEDGCLVRANPMGHARCADCPRCLRPASARTPDRCWPRRPSRCSSPSGRGGGRGARGLACPSSRSSRRRRRRHRSRL